MPVIVSGQLRGGMPLDRHRQLIGAHAVAIVLDHQARQPAAFDAHAHRPGAGIQSVFNQFLGRGRGPLNHLAGGNAVHRLRRQPADLSGRGFQG